MYVSLMWVYISVVRNMHFGQTVCSSNYYLYPTNIRYRNIPLAYRIFNKVPIYEICNKIYIYHVFMYEYKF